MWEKSAGSLTATGVLESFRKCAQSIRTDFLRTPSAQKHVPTPSELGDRSFLSHHRGKIQCFRPGYQYPGGGPALLFSKFRSVLLCLYQVRSPSSVNVFPIGKTPESYVFKHSVPGLFSKRKNVYGARRLSLSNTIAKMNNISKTKVLDHLSG